MPPIPIPLGAYTRAGFPTLPQLNMLAERTPTNPNTGYALVQRPGLNAMTTVGTGPIRGIFQKAGVFDGDAIIVSGQSAYRVTSGGAVTLLTGSVSGVALVNMDGASLAGVSTVRIADGTAVYRVDDTTVTAETFPDGAGVVSVAELDGFWFAVRADTQVIYVQLPGDTAWNALDYTSAEAEPDRLVGVFTLGDELWAFGTDSLQVFYLTGETSPAIRPIPGRRFDVGLKSISTVAKVGDTLVWVDQQNMVEQASTIPQVISDNGISEQIAAALDQNLRAWAFTSIQHRFYVLRIGDGSTWAWDQFTSLWTQFASKGLAYWKPHLGADVTGRVLAADSDSAQVWQVDADTLTDAGDEIVRRCAGYLKIDDAPVPCNRVVATVDQGVGLSTGQGSDPKLLLQLSKNLGKTYDDQRVARIGTDGEFGTQTIWRTGGTLRRPGTIFLVECSDPIRLRLTDMILNPP